MKQARKKKGGKGSKPFGVGQHPRPGGSPKAQLGTAVGPGKNTGTPMPMQLRKSRKGIM